MRVKGGIVEKVSKVITVRMIMYCGDKWREKGVVVVVVLCV